ncbi:hypothetical protein LEP1GSC170_1872 [Leptospira interrogans serovar Bataviae str. HAI135]|nr:hypothetical protein LEP1GSC170_1872 [Leptospira interrogans serovar Bataviae str. HAI135]
MFLILIFASLFIGGPGWLRFFHNFPYEKNVSAESIFPFYYFSLWFYWFRTYFF